MLTTDRIGTRAPEAYRRGVPRPVSGNGHVRHRPVAVAAIERQPLWGRRTLRLLMQLMPVVMAGYALFDRGFAWIHIPHTPFFAGEVVIGLCALAAIVATPYVRAAMHSSLALGLVAVLMTWGLLRTAPLLGTYGEDAIRDAALWYYGIAAIIVAAMAMVWRDLPQRWARAFIRFFPLFLIWAPVSILATRWADQDIGPLVPFTDVSVFSHKVGNTAVLTTMGIALLWLVPASWMPRGWRRIALTAFSVVVLLMVATQNRGGLVAAAAGMLVAACLASRVARFTAIAVGLATVLVLFTVAWGLDIRVPGSQGRDISVAQLVQNVNSIGGQETSGNLNSNVEWRNDLWRGVVQLTNDNGYLLTGWGFGPNLAEQLGFQGQGATPLRSPHNSHVDIFARMGLVGAAIWVTMWAWWYVLLLRGHRRVRLRGEHVRSGLIAVVLTGVTALHVNAYFDPTFESPQVALWLWVLYGLGVALAVDRIGGTGHRSAKRRQIATQHVVTPEAREAEAVTSAA